MDIEKLKKEFPNCNIVSLNDGTGCNLYLPGKLILTIFFKKKIFITNAKKDQYRHYISDQDLNNLICNLGNIKLKKQKTLVYERPPNDTGTQRCIDHILKKMAFMETNQADTKLIVMLKNLSVELQQYL
jgi:hypothetical protein